MGFTVSNQDDATISKLRPAILDCSSPSSGCLEGTRQDILGKINAWGMDFDAPNILWIYGYPGVGKSAIATSAVELWRSSGRFGSSFFFRRDGAESMTPSVLWRTVAHDIGRRDPLIRKHLIGALTEDDSLLTTSNVDALFRQLIHGPLVASTEVAMEKPPIITIDALDECGGLDGRYSDHRKGLMRTLKAWSSLPKKFKLVVTSRRESDIEQLFSGTPHESIGILAGREVVSQSSEDIRAFLRHELRQIVSQYPLMEPDWPGETVIGQLTDLAKGLFIWIKTVIKLLERGQLQRTLKQVLDGAGSMASLYRDILNTSFPNPSNEDTNDFHSILGAIIFAKTPLDVASLTNLFSMDDSTIGYICNGLYSILDPGETLRIHHQSFVDFLLDPKECPAPFLVGRQRENRTLTTACLQVMKKCLRFNICGLESPYICNQDVPDLDSRVKASISPHLSYSSCHWASHLIETNFDAEVYEALQHFMNNQFLFWLEVLSFIKRVNVGSNMLRLLITWIKQFDQDVALAVDMRKFMVAFAYVISQSVPHIYVSALPFAPRCLAVSRKYIGSYPQTLNFQRGGCKNWPAMQCVFSGHTQWVWSVSFSPDGTRIVSGSSDNTIRVWDAETGETLTGPLEGHTDEVSSVSFFPDGTRIISGSFDHTIRVWDAATGEKVMEPWEGHDDQISSVAISPDGIRIVSGSNDKTIRVWDARTGATVVGPLAGHTSEINCVSFSPDGTRIVSGSSDETIRVWDAATGEIVMEILKGHDAQVWSVAFSPDGTRIISGSFDNTIRIWDADTGKPLTEPLEGHKNWVRSVVFSPDGTRILSGSDDRSIRLWDAQMGKTVIEPLRGHTWAIMSVSFSPDGTRIASGAADGTLRVWDVEEGKKVIELQEEHKYWVMNVSFSPDGMRIFSLSRSTTICGWDAETGEAVIKPVECHIDRVMCVALSLDGAHVVVGSKDNVIRVWDAKTGEAVIEPVEGHKDWVTCVSFSLDGRRIISGSYDTTILVWDSATGEAVLGPLEGHTTELTCVSFSPDGKLIASGSQDSTIRVWDAETGETIIGPLEGHYLVNSILFSPDSTRIVSGYGDYTVRVWDVTTGKTVVGPLFGHNGSVGSVSFSPDGTLIVSGSEDRTIRVWDAKTGERVIGPLEGHLTGVNHVSFSPDGTRIVSCSFDNTIRVWDLHTDISSVRSFNSLNDGYKCS
ncbi:hypothetical protein M408DRAFT_72315 [Serendipita vermifera MAFF 305830]|uniref:Nephrocystin 3-like N-terminal domain-containing protein n=1 Tax=Serendipita vermifera MAFF 305830 TaxID=933852 RepID=A0A0C3B5D8_SERVB|nr:hypothetical protein M408DRAFT_72315 [Serendipita vermifera MAFF 305830]